MKDFVSPGSDLHARLLSQRPQDQLSQATSIRTTASPEFPINLPLTDELISERATTFFGSRRDLGVKDLNNRAIGLRCRSFSSPEVHPNQRKISISNPANDRIEELTFWPERDESGIITDWRAGVAYDLRSVTDNFATGGIFVHISLSVGKQGPQVDLRVGEAKVTDPNQLKDEVLKTGSLRWQFLDYEIMAAYDASLNGRKPIGQIPKQPIDENHSTTTTTTIKEQVDTLLSAVAEAEGAPPQVPTTPVH